MGFCRLGSIRDFRQTRIASETGQFTPTAKLALVLCLALDKKFEEIFYFYRCKELPPGYPGWGLCCWQSITRRTFAGRKASEIW